MASPFNIAVWALLGVAVVAKGIHGCLRRSRDTERVERIAKGEHPPRFATYVDYIQSEWWKRIRDATLEHLSYRCDFCGSRAVQAHHTRYPERDMWGTETIEYLCAVCQICHDVAHGRKSQYAREQCAFCGSLATAALPIQPEMSRKRRYQEQKVCEHCEALASGNRFQASGWSQQNYTKWIAEWHARLRPLRRTSRTHA